LLFRPHTSIRKTHNQSNKTCCVFFRLVLWMPFILKLHAVFHNCIIRHVLKVARNVFSKHVFYCMIFLRGCRGSSVVEQWPEEPRVVSSILTRGTLKRILRFSAVRIVSSVPLPSKLGRTAVCIQSLRFHVAYFIA
jgi:hypothetical protein